MECMECLEGEFIVCIDFVYREKKMFASYACFSMKSKQMWKYGVMKFFKRRLDCLHLCLHTEKNWKLVFVCICLFIGLFVPRKWKKREISEVWRSLKGEFIVYIFVYTRQNWCLFTSACLFVRVSENKSGMFGKGKGGRIVCLYIIVYTRKQTSIGVCLHLCVES